mmetsp:Transcript_13410/g.13992  ORF Transcript_13410/g.13992 Transcript_13410/m.13992 type:complete len:317 (+) Transcript_13410:447-1397(+)
MRKADKEINILNSCSREIDYFRRRIGLGKKKTEEFPQSSVNHRNNPGNEVSYSNKDVPRNNILGNKENIENNERDKPFMNTEEYSYSSKSIKKPYTPISPINNNTATARTENISQDYFPISTKNKEQEDFKSQNVVQNYSDYDNKPVYSNYLRPNNNEEERNKKSNYNYDYEKGRTPQAPSIYQQNQITANYNELNHNIKNCLGEKMEDNKNSEEQENHLHSTKSNLSSSIYKKLVEAKRSLEKNHQDDQFRKEMRVEISPLEKDREGKMKFHHYTNNHLEMNVPSMDAHGNPTENTNPNFKKEFPYLRDHSERDE